DIQARLRRYAAQPDPDGLRQRMAASASVESAEAYGAPAIHLVHGRHHVSAVPRDGDHRRVPDVLLSADGRIRLRRHEVSRVRHAVRDADAQYASMGRARNGNRRVAAYVPRVHDGIVQTAARVQLGGRRDPAGADAVTVVHRIPVAMGSTFVLAGDGRIEHGARDAAAWPWRPVP